MTNSELADQIPPLKPPHGEIPAGFCEQHGVWIIVGGLLLIYLAGWVIWLLSRKRKAAEAPPEIEARLALKNLSDGSQSEDVLSQVSRIIKNYFTRAFKLSPGEHTTAEMSALAQASPQIGLDLGQRLSALLVEMDRRKFAEIKVAGVQKNLDEAMALINSAENRRQELRAQELAEKRQNH